MNKNALQKTLTGIDGRTTLACGSAGSGKTVMGMEFLVHGILEYGEHGVFMAFEQTEKDLSQNVASFGYDLEKLQADGKLTIDHVYIERTSIRLANSPRQSAQPKKVYPGRFRPSSKNGHSRPSDSSVICLTRKGLQSASS